MSKIGLSFISFTLFILLSSANAQTASPDSSTTTTTKPPILLSDLCHKSLKDYPGVTDGKALKAACDKVELMTGCQSVNGTPIFHYSKKGELKKASNILVISLIHGDETPAGSVGRFWMERLETIVPRNN